MPTTATNRMFFGYLTSFIMRSVPMLPEPIIAALIMS
jgi:hypothetical protein